MATLIDVPLHQLYIERKSPKPPMTLLRAIDESTSLSRNPTKGVVVLDKTEYLRLLSEALINDTSNLCAVPQVKPKTRGRTSKYYKPLLQKKKILDSILRRIRYILPKTIADSVSPSGSRNWHIFMGWLRNTHKEQLAMRPIPVLSATDK